MSKPKTFIGLACPKCGQNKRYTQTGRCVACNKAQTLAWQKANPERLRVIKRRARKNRVDKARAELANWKSKNQERVRQCWANWYSKNRASLRPKKIAWFRANAERYRFYAMKRHAAKLQRTPVYANLKAIERFYLNCPDGYEVDHIIPLQGKLVSGFHIESNLQYLKKSENLSKFNNFQPIFTSKGE